MRLGNQPFLNLAEALLRDKNRNNGIDIEDEDIALRDEYLKENRVKDREAAIHLESTLRGSLQTSYRTRLTSLRRGKLFAIKETLSKGS